MFSSFSSQSFSWITSFFLQFFYFYFSIVNHICTNLIWNQGRTNNSTLCLPAVLLMQGCTLKAVTVGKGWVGYSRPSMPVTNYHISITTPPTRLEYQYYATRNNIGNSTAHYIISSTAYCLFGLPAWMPTADLGDRIHTSFATQRVYIYPIFW